MLLLPSKSLLTIAAVLEVGLHARSRLVSAKHLAARLNLPARYLESVLQALVRQGVLNGTRGPRGGYTLAREDYRITISDILEAASAADENNKSSLHGSNLVKQIVIPAIAPAEKEFSDTLGQITVEDLARRAKPHSR